MQKQNFEEFIGTGGGEDLFDKAFKLADYLKNSHDRAEQSLGLELLSPVGANVRIQDRSGRRHEAIMLGSNSYLNLTTHPRTVEASEKALKKYGYGMGAVSLYAGITDLHKDLEMEIADFHGTEDAILFSSGYGTNVGVISALCQSGDVVINDIANHASIFDGCRLSGAEIKVYPHNNMKRLEQILSRLPETQKGRMIIVDGVFSMHGDMAPLDEITSLAGKHGARVMVDDAHGLGVVGPTGRGTAEFYGVSNLVDLNVGMLSKTPGGIGGYCAGKKEIIHYLRFYARTYFFSTALPAPTVAGLIEVFRLLKEDKAGRDKLLENVKYIKAGLKRLGFNIGDSNSGIVPIIVGDEEKLGLFHRDLIDAGVYTNLVSYPAVRRKECRLRLCILSALSETDMERALKAFETAGKRNGII